MKSWPTLVPLRHARFYAPKEEVFVTCCQLACKGGVFAARTIIPFSGLILSQHLRRWNWQRFGASPKIISRERSTPVCCPNYKTNSKGAFFWENPKNGFVISDHTDSSPPKKWKIRERIIYHDNGMSSTLRGKKKQQQTDPHGEDKKKEQHQLQMNIRNGYILVWNTNVSRIEHTP